MALPASAPKVTCTLSKPLMADGTEGVIKSASLRIDRDLVWVATGETLYKEAVPVTVATDTGTAGTLSFDVIPVDVTGVRDVAGNNVNNWSYLLRVVLTLPSSQERTVDYVFQPREGLDLDLDMVPQEGAVTLPPSTSPGVIDGGSL